MHFVRYKQRHCTDVFCLILFLIFLFIYVCVSVLAVSQGNPVSIFQPSDSLGNTCGENELQSRPYQLYFDISKCLTDGGLSFICPTTKICVTSCPTRYLHYQSLQTIEKMGFLPRRYTRERLVCIYGFNPVIDNRTISEIVDEGLCAPYTIASEPFLGRCLPSVLTNLLDFENNATLNSNVSVEHINTQMFGIKSLSDVGRVILSDLDQIKDSLALFVLLAGILALLYMYAVKKFTSLIVWLTLILFIVILFIISAVCWYTIYTKQDFVYEYSVVARIVNDFIKLRTLYYIFGCITTFVLIFSLSVMVVLFNRIKLSVILLEQGANAVFSVLTTVFWSPLIIVLFLLLTSIIVYIEMCFATVGKPIFRSMVDNQTVPCTPSLNSTECIFQQEYGYDSLVLNEMDPITGGVIQFLVDNKNYLKWFNLFAYLWFGAFLFAFEEIVLAGVFSDYYWSKERLTTSFPVFYSIMIVVRYHLGSIAFGSLLIATLRYLRMILEYINKKVAKIQPNAVLDLLLKFVSCFLWLFEKFLKFLNKNSYVLIASCGYSFCKATRRAFVYVITNCLRFAVLIHLTEWILFCGTVLVCSCNTYLFYRYLQWTNQFDQLILRWTPIVIILVITYLITSLFFSVYDMAIKTIFVCFLQDLDENDGSIESPYVMNNELLRLVHKTNENKQQTHTHMYE